MSAADEMLEAIGLWECPECHQIIDTTHYYTDRATGTMQHAAEPYIRERLASQCGWRFDDDYGSVVRCAKPHGHFGEHKSAGTHPVRWTDSKLYLGAIPPYDPATANICGRVEGSEEQ